MEDSRLDAVPEHQAELGRPGPGPGRQRESGYPLSAVTILSPLASPHSPHRMTTKLEHGGAGAQ